MKRYNLIASIALATILCSHGVCQTSMEPGGNGLQYNNSALSLLMASAGNNGFPPSNTADPASAGDVFTNKPRWEGTVSLGLTATAGNSDSALATANVRAHRKTPADEWTWGADATYGEANSVKNNETLHAQLQYNHLFDERWYGYAQGEGLHDGVADVRYRFTLSPGVGYYLVKEKDTSLAGEVGPAVLTEKLDGEYHTYPVVRFGERFEHKFDARARLWQTVEILPPVNRPREFLVNTEVGVETPLTKILSLQVYVQDNYANRPAPGFKKNDVKLVSALAIKF